MSAICKREDTWMRHGVKATADEMKQKNVSNNDYVIHEMC